VTTSTFRSIAHQYQGKVPGGKTPPQPKRWGVWSLDLHTPTVQITATELANYDKTCPSKET